MSLLLKNLDIFQMVTKCNACGYSIDLPAGVTLGWHYKPGTNGGVVNVCKGFQMAYGTQKVRIEMEIPADVDPSTVLEMAQEMACDLSDTDDDDCLSEFDTEVIAAAVSVEILPD